MRLLLNWPHERLARNGLGRIHDDVGHIARSVPDVDHVEGGVKLLGNLQGET